MARRNDRDRSRRQDPDEGLSGVGKIAVGVAAAAAGAAIGYFGAKLLSGWLSETAEENDEKDVKKFPKEDKDKDNRLFDKPGDSGNNEKCKDHIAEPPRSNSSRSSIVQTTSQTSLSLSEQLLQYYYEYVDIPVTRTTAAREVVDKVVQSVSQDLHGANRSAYFKVGDLILYGSASEGQQVIHPESFDVMVPILLAEHCTVKNATLFDKNISGCFCINVNPSVACSEALCDEESRVLASRVVGHLQHSVVKAVDGIGYCQPSPVSTSHDHISVIVAESGSRHVVANFVPFIIVSNRLYFPARHVPSSVSAMSVVKDALWLESFMRQEKWSFDRFGVPVSGHVMALKILKAIRLNHLDQFGAVSSYHLKTVLFHALEDLPDSCDWIPEAIGERMIDLLTQLAETLSKCSLPHFFDQNVNCLEHVPADTCTSLAKFIEKRLAHNDLCSLLKQEY